MQNLWIWQPCHPSDLFPCWQWMSQHPTSLGTVRALRKHLLVPMGEPEWDLLLDLLWVLLLDPALVPFFADGRQGLIVLPNGSNVAYSVGGGMGQHGGEV